MQTRRGRRLACGPSRMDRRGGGAQPRASSVHVASQESARVTPRTNIKGGGGVISRGGRWQEVTGGEASTQEVRRWEESIGVEQKRVVGVVGLSSSAAPGRAGGLRAG